MGAKKKERESPIAFCGFVGSEGEPVVHVADPTRAYIWTVATVDRL